MTDRMSRRALLRAGGAGAAALSLAGALPAGALSTRPRLGGYPFVPGVASGDPAADGVTLWTRLGLDALGERPLPDKAIPVRWEIAVDERLNKVVRRGDAMAKPRDGHTVHVDVDGLEPGREYWYRFYADGEASPAGRTKTAPARGKAPKALTFCFVSCQQFEHGYFTAYRRIVEDDPDFLIHVGDYIYEYGPDEYEAPEGNVRHHVGPEITTLADYRRRYGQYHSDEDLREARRLIPFITSFDDHEIENNWAADVPEKDQDPKPFRKRRAAGFRAYYEWMPLRRAQRPKGDGIRLFRELSFGGLATVVVGDTRQFRTDQPCDDSFRTDCPEMRDPAATLPGSEQERWWIERMRRSKGRWNVLAQQVQMAPQDFIAGDGKGYNPDSWDGYRESRKRVLDGFANAQVRNPVVLTGDVHKHYAADLHQNPFDAGSPIVASELVTTSVASGGDGDDEPVPALDENPWFKLGANRRGYVRCTLTEDEYRADFRTLPYVQKHGAPASTLASFVLEDGERGLRDA